MVVYSPISGPRLRYAGDFIGHEIFGQPFVYTNDLISFREATGVKINYSHDRVDDSYWIKPAGLLQESGIGRQDIDMFRYNDRPAFYGSEGEHSFDIFSAVFFLLSRYEEYLPHEKDIYGRYDHRNSTAYRNGFLSQPLVNHWIIDLEIKLKEKFLGTGEFPDVKRAVNFLPTYDIDEAWSFKFKSPLITLGGMAKDLIGGKWGRVTERSKVRRGLQSDPFDSYDWMDENHRKFQLEPRYFFLVAQNRSKYDRNINPKHPGFIELVKEHSKKYKIGIHPSWQSNEKEILLNELALLEEISGVKISSSRQHFIRFTLPQTYRNLIEAGIHEDFSMGYGSINGFRASVASGFYWYDLEKEEQTPLQLFPFCFMDANCFFELKQTPAVALDQIKAYYQEVHSVKGTFISIWHNTFLGTDPLFKGWREAYASFLEDRV